VRDIEPRPTRRSAPDPPDCTRPPRARRRGTRCAAAALTLLVERDHFRVECVWILDSHRRWRGSPGSRDGRVEIMEEKTGRVRGFAGDACVARLAVAGVRISRKL
jgi:hypothetical protein